VRTVDGARGARVPARPEDRATLRKWRLNVSLDDISRIRRKFDQAGVELSAYAYNIRDDFTDEEIARASSLPRRWKPRRLPPRRHHARIVTPHSKDRKKNQGRNMPFGEGPTPIGRCCNC
jgi:hypothetical protein